MALKPNLKQIYRRSWTLFVTALRHTLPSFVGGIAVVLVIIAVIAIGERAGVRMFGTKQESQSPEPMGPTKQT